MKNKILFLSILLFSFLGCNEKTANYVLTKNPRTGKEMAVGKITRDVLFNSPFKEWAQKEYDEYQVDVQALDSVNLPDFDMIIVLGTWCPDSRREVPRMFKILDYIKYPTHKLTIYCVDRNKKAGNFDIKDLGIQRIPTFIFYVDGKEVGRIVESPQASLEQDMIRILTH